MSICLQMHCTMSYRTTGKPVFLSWGVWIHCNYAHDRGQEKPHKWVSKGHGAWCGANCPLSLAASSFRMTVSGHNPAAASTRPERRKRSVSTSIIFRVWSVAHRSQEGDYYSPHGKKRSHVHVWRGEAQTDAGSLRQESTEEDWAARWPPCTIKEDYSIMIRSVFLSIKRDIYSACIIGKRHNVLSTSTGHTIPFSRASSQPRDQTQVSCIAGGFLASWATREAQGKYSKLYKVLSRIKRHDPGELWTIWS